MLIHRLGRIARLLFVCMLATPLLTPLSARDKSKSTKPAEQTESPQVAGIVNRKASKE